MRITLFIVMILFLYASALAGQSPNTRDAYRFRGSTVNDLIRAWGKPDLRVNHASGNISLIYHVITYQSAATQGSPEIGVNVSPSGRPVIITNPSPNPIMNRSLSIKCDIEFKANKQGIISKVQMAGAGC